jgi:hypothetical protein
MIPEINPWKTTWLYTLSWETDDWTEVKTQCQVYNPPRYDEMWAWQLFINWTFELYAPDPIYQWLITKTNNGVYGRKWGVKLWTTLWTKLNELLAEISVENTWNWTAPVRIEIKGNIENPKIKNMTNNTFYWLSRTCNDLLIDWTWTWLIVTDNWINVKADRMPWSEILRVEPWVNTYILKWTNFSYDSEVVWSLFFNDTFL